MVAKLLFRVIDPDKRVDRGQVFKDIMTKLKIPMLGLKPVNVGYNALLEREEDVDVILSESGISVLKELNLTARIPPDVRARRSLFLRRIDAYVGAHTAQELKSELEHQNNWLKIREVFKIKEYTHVLKIECNEVQMADRALQQGLLCYYSKIAASQIERETYVSLQLCFKCYKYEEHPTAECPEGNVTWCSECSSKEHTFRECKSNEKRCLNCHGPHRTMAMACKVKKQLMTNKIQKQNEQKLQKSHQTYASVARTAASAAIAETIKTTPTIQIQTETELKTIVAILNAHVHNLIIPGTFKSELNKTLTTNDLPLIETYDNPPSQKLFNVEISDNITQEQRLQVLETTKPHPREPISESQPITTTPTRKQKDTMKPTELTTIMQAPKPTIAPKPQRQTKARDARTSESKTDEEDVLTRQTTQITATQKASDLYVQTYMKERDKPKRDLTTLEYYNYYKQGRLKFILDYDCDIQTEEFEIMIQQRSITETVSNITAVKDDIFKKIRNGRERTPTASYERESKTAHIR